MRLRQNLQWWKQHATPWIQSLVLHGVSAPWVEDPPLSIQCKTRPVSDIQLAECILQDYKSVGAVKEVSMEGTEHLIPWFIISKEEPTGMKHRLISDCREINQFLETQRFALDNIQNILPFLQKGQWAGKIDLKDAYFHLGVHPRLRPYLRMQVGERTWEFQAGCFGLNIMPQLFIQLMKTFQTKWRRNGILVFVYLDDILVLGTSKKVLESHLGTVTQDLVSAGFKINLEKSVLQPCQEVIHLGFNLNLKEGCLQLSPSRLKTVRKELGKIVVAKKMSTRKMAAILGKVRSFLVALPFLRAFTDQLCKFVQQGALEGWNSVHPIPPFSKIN